MINHSFTIPESIHTLINDHYAEKVLKGIEDYGVELKFDIVMKLVGYEDSLNEIIISESLTLKKDGLSNLMSKEEKEGIVSDSITELNAIASIKNRIELQRWYANYYE